MSATITNTILHRNGVAGEPFAVVEFDCEEGGTIHRLTAIVPTALEDTAKAGHLGEVQCYVIDRADPGSKWRGDTIFGDLLLADLWGRIEADSYDRMVDGFITATPEPTA